MRTTTELRETMTERKKPQHHLELNAHEFERLLDLVDILDEVQLLRLQCKVAAMIGDPPQWGEPASPKPAPPAPAERRTGPPPPGLHGPYAPPEDEYEELDISWEDEEGDGV